jgi:hypothetical protein
MALLEPNTWQEMPTLTSPSLGVNFICSGWESHITHTITIFRRDSFEYRIGDEVADYLLDSINVDADNKVPLRL